jgi:hypothetical protein
MRLSERTAWNPQTGPATGAGGIVVQRQGGVKETVETLRERLPESRLQQPEAGATLEVLVQFDQWMRGLNIQYRFGGSLAAFAHGGTRLPADIDVEVNSPDNMRKLLEVMWRAPAVWHVKWPQDVSELKRNPLSEWDIYSLAAYFPPVSIVATPKEYPNITFDIVSEVEWSGPVDIRQGMQIDAGDIGPTGHLVGVGELILNYLDRLEKKPTIAKAKGDKQQIEDLVRSSLGPGEHLRDFWDREMAPVMKRDSFERYWLELLKALLVRS